MDDLHRWSFGSVLFLASWAVLMGPFTYAKHLISGPRLPFTAVYFGAIGLTLFSAMKVCMIPSSLEVSFFKLALEDLLPTLDPLSD